MFFYFWPDYFSHLDLWEKNHSNRKMTSCFNSVNTKIYGRCVEAREPIILYGALLGIGRNIKTMLPELKHFIKSQIKMSRLKWVHNITWNKLMQPTSFCIETWFYCCIYYSATAFPNITGFEKQDMHRTNQYKRKQPYMFCILFQILNRTGQICSSTLDWMMTFRQILNTFSGRQNVKLTSKCEHP